MDKLTKVKVKKYYDTIKNSNKKYVDSSYLSSIMGIREDVIREDLSYFDDLIRLLDDFNLVDILPLLHNYINTRTKREKTSTNYESVTDFIYKNMTDHGGLVNKNVKLNKQLCRCNNGTCGNIYYIK